MMGSEGEIGVVVLVIGRVVFTTPFDLLLWEILGLISLGFFGLFIELLTEKDAQGLKFNHPLRPRLGSSSGIFLGAVTLPIVLMSRLIQLGRSNLEQGLLNTTPYLEKLRLQYWVSCASSLGVLFFLLFYRDGSQKGANALTARVKNLLLSLVLIIVFGAECIFSLTKSPTSNHSYVFSMTMALAFLLINGFGARLILQYILEKFPSCLSIGEALLVSAGIILSFSNVIAYGLIKVNWFDLPNSYLNIFNEEEDDIGAVIQACLGSLLLTSYLYKAILCILDYIKATQWRTSSNADNSLGNFQRSVAFYVSLISAITMLAPAWLFAFSNFQTHPLLWVIDFMIDNAFKRLALCIYWIVLICIAVQRFYYISKGSKIERILLRKYYHLLAVMMFVPALIVDPGFLKLAFGMALLAFLVLEMIRVWQILPLGSLVDQFMNAFTDHRDSETLIISHFSLLLGCAMPIWMSGHLIDRPLAQFAGILSLGIGDTMASLIGYKYGVLRWSKSGKKTIEGTAAGITSVLLACIFLLPSLAWTGLASSQGWISLLIAVVLAGLLEAYTTQLDNAFIPLIFYGLLCI